MRGDMVEARSLRNQVNRATAKLKFEFYHTRIEAMHESGTNNWWKNMKKLMGQKTTDKSNVQSLANKTTDGNVELLASKMNDFFVSVSEHLPRLDRNNEAFDVEGQLPDEYVIDLTTTLQALRKVKANKATGPDNVPAWILKNHANILAGPLTAIFNSSLREGIIPDTWKSANVIPVPKVNPPNTIEKDVRPISLTPIASKTLESIILNMVNEKNSENIKRNQFGGMGGASTTDALVEMIHRWSEATDKLDHYVIRVALLDFSKAFDLINHNILLAKLKQYDLPPHIRRWIATFLLDRTQQVKIGNNISPPGHPKGGVPQGTWLGPKCFLVYINDLETPGNEYADILCLTKLPCLKERRDSLCKKYFQNIMETTHRLNYLLPCQRCNQYDVRRFNKYPLPEIRTNRYRNSLIPWGLYHWQ